MLLTTPSSAPYALRQLQLPQVEEQAETGPTGEACAQLSPTYEQQMTDPFMDVLVVQANPNLSFSYEEFMEDIIAGRRVPEFEETCNEEAH